MTRRLRPRSRVLPPAPRDRRGVAAVPSTPWPTAFGETPTGPYLDTPPPSPSWTGRWGCSTATGCVATAGIYSRTSPCPAPSCRARASPGHRRADPPPARRAHRDHAAPARPRCTSRQREPVAALWAAEYPIYGRFGYAPASLPRRADRPHRAAAAAPRRRPRHGPGRRGRRGDLPSPRADGSARRGAPARARQPRPRRPLVGPPCSATDPSSATAPRRSGSCCTREADGTVTGYAAWRHEGQLDRRTASPTAR